MTDLHVGSTGAAQAARALFSGMNGTAGAIACEVNSGIHTFERALMEALDLNQHFNLDAPSNTGDSSRMKGRMSSFCMERSGHLCSEWDQGISFFSADKLWLQPPGTVHKMFHDAWQPRTADVQVVASLGCVGNVSAACGGSYAVCCVCGSGAGGGLGPPGLCTRESASAASSDDGAALSVRYVNPTQHAVAVSVKLPSAEWKGKDMTTLAWDDLNDANPANDTARIAPQTSALPASPSFEAPPQSIIVLRFVRGL